MTRKASLIALLFVSASPLPALAQQAPPATAQPAPEPAEEDDGADIVVVGQKPRGSVVGDIPAENVLTRAEIRATGTTVDSSAKPRSAISPA